MSPERYNRIKEANGDFTEEHKKLLVEFFQASDPDLIDDGCMGPLSIAALEAHFGIAQVAERQPSELAQMAVTVAREELKNGEEHQDNAGRHIHRYRDFPYGDDFTRVVGDWCAFFAGYCLEEAAHRLDVTLPFKRRFYDRRLNRYMPIGSALRLVRWMGEGGEFVVHDGHWKGELLPGDVFSISRPGKGKGHVGIIIDPRGYRKALTIEGNTMGRRKPFKPSFVRVRMRDFTKMNLVDVARV
jgi:hypothetical protein